MTLYAGQPCSLIGDIKPAAGIVAETSGRPAGACDVLVPTLDLVCQDCAVPCLGSELASVASG